MSHFEEFVADHFSPEDACRIYSIGDSYTVFTRKGKAEVAEKLKAAGMAPEVLASFLEQVFWSSTPSSEAASPASRLTSLWEGAKEQLATDMKAAFAKARMPFASYSKAAALYDNVDADKRPYSEEFVSQCNAYLGQLDELEKRCKVK